MLLSCSISMYQSVNVHISATCPILLPTLCPQAILCVNTSIAALQIGSLIPFSRFHIYALIHNIYFSLSDFTLYDRF